MKSLRTVDCKSFNEVDFIHLHQDEVFCHTHVFLFYSNLQHIFQRSLIDYLQLQKGRKDSVLFRFWFLVKVFHPLVLLIFCRQCCEGKNQKIFQKRYCKSIVCYIFKNKHTYNWNCICPSFRLFLILNAFASDTIKPLLLFCDAVVPSIKQVVN